LGNFAAAAAAAAVVVVVVANDDEYEDGDEKDKVFVTLEGTPANDDLSDSSGVEDITEGDRGAPVKTMGTEGTGEHFKDGEGIPHDG
jgi:hypothetical protein